MIDSHAHLDAPQFDRDREAVVERASAAGLGAIVTIGTDLESARAAVQLAETYSCVYAAVGVDPHDAASFDDQTLPRLRELARHPKVVAIGEIGLDYFRDFSPRPMQAAAFRRQLELADEVGLPVVIHIRDAYPDALDVLTEWTNGRDRPERPHGVLHCFAGTVEEALRGVDLGFIISIAGPVTYPKPGALPEVVQALPVSAMVVETDSPYLPPQPKRGKRNEPAYVTMVAAAVAELRGLPIAEVDAVTTANAKRLFGIDS